jgi:hypothetical protein
MSSLMRKVDQHLNFAHQIFALASSSGNTEACCVATAIQLERAICFYLNERVAISGNRSFEQPWILDSATFQNAFYACPSSDIQEFIDLLSLSDSWLCELLWQLSEMRQIDKKGSLKGEIFLSDLASPESHPQLIATSAKSEIPATQLHASLADTAQITLLEFSALVSRQRLAGAEW